MVTMIQDTSINHMDIMMITKVVHYSQLLTKTLILFLFQAMDMTPIKVRIKDKRKYYYFYLILYFL